MAANLLLNQISSEFGGDAINRIASTLGESVGSTKTALSGMLPALLGGLAGKAQTKEGAHELLDVIGRNRLDTDQYEHVEDAIKTPNAFSNLMNMGRPLLDSVLPGKSSAVSDWAASQAGIKPASSMSLMSMVLPLVLGMIGRRVGSGGESGLMSLLGKPQSFLQDAPGGLTGILGMGGAAAGAARAAMGGMGQSGQQAAAAASASPWRKWLIPLLVLLGLIALGAYFMKRQAPKPMSPPAPAATVPAVTAPAATAPVAAGGGLGAFMDWKLPNGVTLRIPSNGVESKLIGFIGDTSKPVSPTTWFSFDRVEFDTDAATLRPSSQEQLSNIAEIMKAYPQVTVKLGGYTDNTGNPEHNLQLSRARANSAMNQVVALGINSSRLSAEGYGEQHPIADNATPEGRQRNRRIDINVTAK